MTSWGLENRIVPVSGAASGIGLSISKQLREGGAVPILVDSNEERLHAAFREVYGRHYPGEFSKYCFVLDTRHSDAIDKCFLDVQQRHGYPITHAVANAGVRHISPATEISDKNWLDVIDVNLNGLFFFCRAAAKQCIQARSGSIVTISSTVALRGSPGRSSYVASKGAIIALTKSLASELGPAGVRVNCVAPGPTDTPLYKQNPGADREKTIAKIALRRFGRPEEIASAVLFLLSDAASFVTGETLVADGGWFLGN